ncbi:MAG: hypothetical protein JWL96_2345, partial [Sphingomonas bacterium]|nr:hypothetical protein [Sphingomonas bacterium]
NDGASGIKLCGQRSFNSEWRMLIAM